MAANSTSPDALQSSTEIPDTGAVEKQIALYQAAADLALEKQNKFTIAKLLSDTTLGIGKQRPQF